MALSKKSKCLLLKAKMHLRPIKMHQTIKLIKGSNDNELYMIYDLVGGELKKRGIL